MIEYYNNLSKQSEKRKENIEKHINHLKTLHLDNEVGSSKGYNRVEDENSGKQVVSLNKSDSSTDTFHSIEDLTKNPEEEEVYVESMEIIETDEAKTVPSSNSLDRLNANIETVEINNEVNRNITMAMENSEMARKNKAKVMSVELGIDYKTTQIKKKILDNQNNLTELQRNRLKVMSTEFNIPYQKEEKYEQRELTSVEINRRRNMSGSNTKFGSHTTEIIKARERPLTIVEVNRRKMLSSNESDYGMDYTMKSENNEETIDNENFVNQNNDADKKLDNVLIIQQKSPPKLTLDFSHFQQPSIFTKFLKTPNFELEKPIPMSIDSTPLSDLTTPVHRLNLENILSETESQSQATTAATNFTDEGFHFETKPSTPNIFSKIHSANAYKSFTKRMNKRDSKQVSQDCLNLFIEQNVSILLSKQTKLVHMDLMRYFVENLQYLKHLNSLRNYFFLMDGEFGRNVTEGLFEKLYDTAIPADFINCRVLQLVLFRALDSSCKYQENSDRLSFKIDSLPKRFDLVDPNVLDCLSLVYKVDFPLNIVLPSDTIGKYDEVFKYLLKLHRVSWVLKKVFQVRI